MKMKTLTRGMIGLLALAVAAAMVGCANTAIKHVSADEFIREAGTGEQMNSASGTFYIGASATRVYVERTGLYRLFPLHKAMVYWTELDALPTDMADALRSRHPPWTPWQDKMKKANQVPEDTARKLADPQH